MREPDAQHPQKFNSGEEGEHASELLLIVDDRDDDAFLLEHLLRRLGVANPILKLSSGEEAIAYLSGAGEFRDRKRFRLPSVLFLDLKMAGASGFDVLQWLQDHPLPRKCLVLVVSELHASSDINLAYRLGADSFMSKPLNEAEFRECLRNHSECWEFGNPRVIEAELGCAQQTGLSM